jgi:hypothetical protein
VRTFGQPYPTRIVTKLDAKSVKIKPGLRHIQMLAFSALIACYHQVHGRKNDGLKRRLEARLKLACLARSHRTKQQAWFC